jgi:hypothetical protein
MAFLISKYSAVQKIMKYPMSRSTLPTWKCRQDLQTFCWHFKPTFILLAPSDSSSKEIG